MSLRGTKRAISRGEDAGASKRRRAEQEETWQARPVSDLKASAIYNRSAPEAPAELFRKDLISAMKLPDSEPLASDEYWVITDPWKQEWERGVQVPVNPDSLPEPTVTEIEQNLSLARNEFKLPKQKYVRLTRDGHFNSSDHYLSSAVARAEAACAYDMDACDAAWLKALNGERARSGAQPLREEQLEKVIEELEVRCWDKIQAIVKSEEGLGIEYDENVICDVCRSPDSEEGNEMVFCDSCNICVHQACYGITAIPSGQWLCRPCGDGVRPVCVLCPNLGGAMKCTPSGHKWAHVSCVLWIPEVSIGCAEKMEPITKISAIPASRWSLICVLCRERTGACIQCSVKTCKTAYHVTCAFKHGLEMRAIIEDENADDGVKLRSYCQKHSVNSKKDKCAGSGSEEDDSKRKRRKDMTSEEKTQARAIRLHEIEAEFDRHVSIKDISTHLLDVDQDGIQYMYNYWKLKRKAGNNRPLLPPKSDESDMLTHRQEQADLDKMKKFVQLRQDLERVRNLCYMVSRREKLSRSFFQKREQTFHKQVAVLSGEPPLTPAAVSAVIEANHGPSIYDRLYSHPGAVDHSADFDNLLAQIAGLDSGDDKKNLNGLMKNAKSAENPYKRLYLNGSTRRSASLYSGLSSGAESIPDLQLSESKYRKPIYSTTDDDEKPSLQTPKKKLFPKERESSDNIKVSDKKKSRTSLPSKSRIDSSSEDEKPPVKKEWPRSRTLRQMEREMGAKPLSGSESDELMPIRAPRKSKLSADIYSDSESSDHVNKQEDINEDKSSNATSDSQQHPFRTKAAVKEFIPLQKGTAKATRQSKKPKGPDSDEDTIKDKENLKTSKNKDNPSDLIVPQRQAAKKASENMRSNTVAVKTKDQNETNIDPPKPTPVVEELKSKVKAKVKEKRKEGKEMPVKDAKKESKSSTTVNDVFEFEKEIEKDASDILAYVPQRQAAKKAAEHIKSGMTKVPGTENVVEEVGKKKESTDAFKKLSPKKDEEKRQKSPNKSSSSSTNDSSSSSCSSSTGSECEEESGKVISKVITDKRNTSKSLSPNKRMSVDLPFLDKGSKVISSSSPSSDSEALKDIPKEPPASSSPRRSRQKKAETPPQAESSSKEGEISPTKAPDKKLKTSDGQPDSGHLSPSAEREKPRGPNQPLPRSSARTRTRSTAAGPRNLPDRKDARQGKPNKGETATSSSPCKDPKESSEPSQLPPAEWKKDKKVKQPKTANVKLAKNANASTQPPPQIDKIDIVKSEERAKPINPKANTSKLKKKSVTPEKAPVSVKSDDNISKNSLPFTASPPQKTDLPKISCKSPDPVQKHSISSSDANFGSTDVQKPSADNGKQIADNGKKTEKEHFSSQDKTIYKTPSRIFSNTHMIKSPKTPLDIEHKMPEPCEGQTPKLHEETRDLRNSRITHLESAEKVSSFEIVPPEFNEIQEIDHTKNSNKGSLLQSTYVNRSIFSPPPVSKDPASDIFDFGHDILAVDETVHDDDGFNIPQGNEEMMKSTPLGSFFGPDFLFKEDSKEDRGVRETLNLVEKLRMTLISKKSGACNQNESISGDMNDFRDQGSFTDPEINKKDQELSKHLDKSILGLTEEDNRKTVLNTSQQSLDNVCDMSQKVDNTLIESSLHVKDLEDRDINTKTEDIKKWTADNRFHEESSTNIDMDNMDSIKGQDVLLDTRLQNEFIEKMQSQDMLSKDSFLQTPEPNKNFECHTEENTCSSMQPMVVQRNDTINESVQSHTYDGDASLQPPECTPIPSPYNSQRQQSKWAESELIPERRSSISSSTSDSSSSPPKQDDTVHSKSNANAQGQSHTEMLQEIGYSGMQPYPCSMDTHSYNPFSSEASYIVGPVSLFPPTTTIGSQLPLSSPGPALFPPMLSYSNSSSLLSHLPKSNEEPLSFTTTCSAAFTSSSHNMALTTAMVAPPTPKPVSETSPSHDIESQLTPPNSFSMQQSPMTLTEEFSNRTAIQNQLITQKPSPGNEISPLQGKRSPTKPTRMSSRFISQHKSPGKSPGKSPKQVDAGVKSNQNRRGVSRNTRGARGGNRGRPRGKNSHSMHQFIDSDYHTNTNTIHNKLIGTVYDLNFDEDMSNDTVSDLKTMRERRRSTDIHERKPDNAYRDSSQSPKFTSPPHQTKRSSYGADIRDLRPPSPIPEVPAAVEAAKTPPVSVPVESVQASFPSIVQPVLPGPVNMRTYAFEPMHAFNNQLLGAFASGTADQQQFQDLDEEMEKAFHSALIASSNKSQEPFLSHQLPLGHNEPVVEESHVSHDVPTPKVSLTDSRNQLKVKIKGPFLDANYSGNCSVTPVIQQPSIPTVEQPSGVSTLGAPSAVNSVTPAMMSGTSNLRRMRKKELLRQYCTQDMNMDEATPGLVVSQAVPPVPVNTFNRTIITIPKAVASMTSIPTREDYKAVVDANMEKKRRKITSGLSRDHRSLDNDDDLDDIHNTSGLSIPTQLALSYKRRGRMPKPTPFLSGLNPIQPAPKLKIKIGSFPNTDQSTTSNSDYVSQFKPPKKRLTSIPKPSVEDLRRESMKFRRKVMADFEEGEKEKKKRIKSEKRKKKKEKRASEMHFVKKQSESTTKLVIRIARKKEEAGGVGDSVKPDIKGEDESNSVQPEPPPEAKPAVPAGDPFEYDPTAQDPLALDSPSCQSPGLAALRAARASKVSPIRLKLARGAGGTGYVMKDSPGAPAEEASSVALLDPSSADPLGCPPLTHNKHCEVR